MPGLTVFPSHANFVYLQLDERGSGRRLRNRLLEHHGLFVRECSNKVGASEDDLRLAVLPPPAQDRLVAALRIELGGARPGGSASGRESAGEDHADRAGAGHRGARR